MDILPGKFTITGTDEALTTYGGLATWSSFLKHLGTIERLADHYPIVRTSPNAAPVREVLHNFLPGALVEDKRFCHVRWVMDDPAVATLMEMERVRSEYALPRLGLRPDRDLLRQWLHRPRTELYAAPLDRFVAGWDSTVNTRYGHQGDTAVSYNHHKRGRKSPHALVCVAAQVVEIGRQRAHQLAAKSEWWQLLKGCYKGLRTWLATTAGFRFRTKPKRKQSPAKRRRKHSRKKDGESWLKPSPSAEIFRT